MHNLEHPTPPHEPFGWLQAIKDFPKDQEHLYRLLAIKMARFLYKPEYIDFHKLPDEGPAVLVCNHVTYVDGMLVQAAFPKRNIRFVIDGHIYKVPGVHYFMSHNRAIPILPNRKSVTEALDQIAEALEEGDLVCIFPEGQLTYTGSLSRFRPGIEHIIERTPVPVYPLALNGLWGSIFSRKYLNSWFRFWPRHRDQPVKVICGDAVAPEDVTKNMLQNDVMRLKYKIMAMPAEKQ